MAGVYIGKTAVVTNDILPANTNQAVGIIRLDQAKADCRFVGYYLRQRQYNQYVNNLVAQSAQPNLNLAEIGNLPIRIPPLHVQHAIADILGALDDKIELNRRTNETLEAMARAVFKSWFVDFDPVQAKSSGRQPDGVDAETAKLFPSSFEDSEIGRVPKGWKVKSLWDVATYVNGSAFRNEDFCEQPQGKPIIKITEIKSGITDQTKFTAADLPEKYAIADGEMLFSWSGSPDTSIDTFIWMGGDGWLNQHIFRVIPKSEMERNFVFCLLKHLKQDFVEIARDKQTTGLGHVTVKDLQRFLVAIPDDAAMASFYSFAEPFYANILSLMREWRTLRDLRDALLPKLLSGEIAVPASKVA